MDYHDLRKKYPKWAHRRDYHKKKRRRSRRRRRRRARATTGDGTVTNVLLMQLLNQIMGVNVSLAKAPKKHGENVLTGYANVVTPAQLAPVRARAWYNRERNAADQYNRGFEAAVGVAARAGFAHPMPN